MNAYSNEAYCLAPGMYLVSFASKGLMGNEADSVSEYVIFDQKKDREYTISVYEGRGVTFIYSRTEHGSYGDIGSYSKSYNTLPKKWADMGL